MMWGCVRLAGLVIPVACTVLAAEGPAPAWPVVAEGGLRRDGKAFRAVGTNYCDLFQELIADGAQERTLAGLRFLGQKRIPFVRFWACGFWPSDWDLYQRDRAEWFRRLDRVVRTAEEAGVGLVPSLFWSPSTISVLVDEYQDQWANPDSRTQAFMRTYVAEVVGRYKDSPAIWGWEFANELSLACDLPNGMEFLGKELTAQRVRGNAIAKDKRNLWTWQQLQAAFGAFVREVRKLDSSRFITTGNSRPRQSAWHQSRDPGNPWGLDSEAQAEEAFGWLNPDGHAVVASIHMYPEKPGRPYGGAADMAAEIALLERFAARHGQPLFVGEFAGGASEEVTVDEFRRHQQLILDAIVAARADLAAYWVFDYTADRKGVGLVRRDNDWAWVLDQLVEYNAKLQAAPAP